MLPGPLWGVPMILWGFFGLLSASIWAEAINGINVKILRRQIDVDLMTMRSMMGGVFFIVFGLIVLLAPAFKWVLGTIATAAGY